MFSKFLFFCLVLQLVSGNTPKQTREDDPEDCYSTAEPPREHKRFGTKTAYADLRKNQEEPQYTVQGCNPVRIWILSRHGAVIPTGSTLVELMSLADIQPLIVEDDDDELTPPPPLCAPDIALLKAWTWVENNTRHPEALSIQGWKEMKTLADDYERVYHDLFASAGNVLFRNTTDARNEQSTFGFATALFNAEDVKYDNLDNDMLLKFYDKCDKWSQKNAALADSESDLSKFENSDTFKDTIKRVSERLGITEPLLTVKQVQNMWDMCRFDRAWDNEKLSPWCAPFTEDHIKTLEYREDIELYYKTGHGDDNINSRLACATVADLMNHLENENATAPKAIVSIADATTIQLLLTALGTHNDTIKPNTENMDGMDQRMWKSSEMSPFAANLAVVKFECSDEEPDQLKFFLNQKLLVPEWCTSDDVCTLDKFVETYLEYKEANCTQYFCANDTSGETTIMVGTLVMVVSLILVYLQ